MNIRRAASAFLPVLGVAYLGSFSHFTPQPSQEQGSVLGAQVIQAEEAPSDRTPETYQGSFFYATADDMLAALGVRTYPEDKIFAFPDPALGIGSTVKVYRAQPVLISDAGSDTLVRTWAKTVGEALAEQRLDIGDKDIVQPTQQTVLEIGDKPFSISITRVAESTVTTKESIDFSTRYTDDSNLERGVTKVEQAGQTGVLAKTFQVRRENGQEVSRVLTDKEVTKQPVEEIIRRGTKVIEYGSGKASWYGGVGSMTAAHPSLPFGTRIRVVNVANGKSVTVRIADRGPFVAGRVIDLSQDAFSQIASLGSGVIQVRLEEE